MELLSLGDSFTCPRGSPSLTPELPLGKGGKNMAAGPLCKQLVDCYLDSCHDYDSKAESPLVPALNPSYPTFLSRLGPSCDLWPSGGCWLELHWEDPLTD